MVHKTGLSFPDVVLQLCLFLWLIFSEIEANVS